VTQRKGLPIGLGAAAVLVLIAGAVIAVVLTMATDVGSITVTQRHAEAHKTAIDVGEPQAAGVSEEVRDGDFAFVVNGVRTTDVIGDPKFPELTKSAEGEYVIVALTVTNVSADPHSFFASFITLSDGTTVFASDNEAWLYLGDTVADVGPGRSIDTEVVFDVPRGTNLESIWLRGGPLSDGVAVAV
jgi:hypothetical protein